MTKITLHRLNDSMHFEMTNATGHSVQTDSSPDAGGQNLAVRPMEMLLMALASCSTIDVVLILKKMRQQLDDVKVEVTGERAEDEVPKIYKKIHLHYKLYGEIGENQAKKAIGISIEKYCSVAKMIDSVADITWDFEIITNQ